MCKKIAIVLDCMNMGGVEKALAEMLKQFNYDDYEVTVWLKDASGELFSSIDSRVEIQYWGCADTRTVLKEQFRHGQWISAVKGLYYRIKSRKYISEYDLGAFYSARALPVCTDTVYDCVIAYQILSPAVVSTALYRLKGKKRILWVHGRNVRPEYLNSFFDKVYSRFDLIACVSENTRLDFCRDFQISALKTATIYNLFDIRDIVYRAAQEHEMKFFGNVLVTVGRLVSIKGQQMIPQITRILLNDGYDIHWYLIGDGPLRETIESECEKYDVKDRVILLGTKENPYPYIKNCDIYVQTSYSEGFCTTTNEAKILCKSVVTTDAPGMREQFVSGENGLIVDSMTAESIADGIRYLLDHPEIREKFVTALQNETFDNQKELQKLYDFIEN